MFSLATKKSRLLMWIFCGLLLVSCGEEYNINQIFVSNQQKKALQSLIEKAQLHFDKGEYDKALSYAEKAEKISPANENIAILLGYIHLSLAGMDPFRIADALVTASNKDKTDDDDDEDSALLASSSNKASEFLTNIIGVLNLDEDTLKELGELSGSTDLSAFEGLDVIHPSSADDARDVDVPIFNHINAAIAKICPFLSDDVKTVSMDSRHSTDNCVATETEVTQSVISNFLWAFVHIAEAATFFGVLQYQDADSTDAHITARATAMQAALDDNSLSITEYATHAVSLAESVDLIFAVEDSGSQFSAVLNDIAVAVLAFAEIGNMPRKMKKALLRASTSISDTASSASGSSDDEQERNALKSQVTSEITSSLADEISSLDENDEDYEENLEALCESYDSISGSEDSADGC